MEMKTVGGIVGVEGDDGCAAVIEYEALAGNWGSGGSSEGRLLRREILGFHQCCSSLRRFSKDWNWHGLGHACMLLIYIAGWIWDGLGYVAYWYC